MEIKNKIAIGVLTGAIILGASGGAYYTIHTKNVKEEKAEAVESARKSAKAVDLLIAKIGKVDSDDDKAKIEAAEKAYNKLSKEEKKYVHTYGTLKEAKNGLKDYETAKKEAEKKAIETAKAEEAAKAEAEEAAKAQAEEAAKTEANTPKKSSGTSKRTASSKTTNRQTASVNHNSAATPAPHNSAATPAPAPAQTQEAPQKEELIGGYTKEYLKQHQNEWLDNKDPNNYGGIGAKVMARGGLFFWRTPEMLAHLGDLPAYLRDTYWVDADDTDGDGWITKQQLLDSGCTIVEVATGSISDGDVITYPGDIKYRMPDDGFEFWT